MTVVLAAVENRMCVTTSILARGRTENLLRVCSLLLEDILDVFLLVLLQAWL